MFRDSAAPDSMFVDLVVNGTNEVSTQWRNADGRCDFLIARRLTDFNEDHPLSLKLVKSGAKVTGYYSGDGKNWHLAGATWMPFKNKSYLGGLAISSNSDFVANNSTFTNVEIVPAARNASLGDSKPDPTLPAGFSHHDIGSPQRAGSAFYNPADATWTVSGSGEDTWERDQFHYVSKRVEGDQMLIAKVIGMSGTNEICKSRDHVSRER